MCWLVPNVVEWLHIWEPCCHPFVKCCRIVCSRNRLRRKNRCTTFYINFQLFIVFTFTFCCSGAKVWSYFILLSVCHQHRVLPDTFNFLSEICQAKANFNFFRLKIFLFIFLVWLAQFHFLKRMKLQRLMLITLNQTQRKLPHISLSQ